MFSLASRAFSKLATGFLTSSLVYIYHFWSFKVTYHSRNLLTFLVQDQLFGIRKWNKHSFPCRTKQTDACRVLGKISKFVDFTIYQFVNFVRLHKPLSPSASSRRTDRMHIRGGERQREIPNRFWGHSEKVPKATRIAGAYLEPISNSLQKPIEGEADTSQTAKGYHGLKPPIHCL